MPFKVKVSSRGVTFSIDHQAFALDIVDDPSQEPMERYRWYAKQLRAALKRLEGTKAK